MKMNIHGKALLFICAAGVSTSLLLGSMFFLGLKEAENLLDRQVVTLAGNITQEAENFAEDEVRKRMESVILQKAYYVEIFMQELEGDVAILAKSMTNLTQENSAASTYRIYDPRQENVRSGQLYFLAGASGGSPSPKALQSANIGDVMHRLAKSYEAAPMLFYIGSKDGWSLRMDFMSNPDELIVLPAEALTPAYDTRDRYWYKLGKEAVGKDVAEIIPIYASLGGETLLACVMPYEDADGFAGVVGISIAPVVLQQEIKKEVLTEDNISFLINPQGQIVLSSAKEGTFAPNRPDFDLRKTDNQALSQAAEDMIAGNNNSKRVQVDGEDCYLVYAHVGDKGWSYGELVKLEEVRSDAQFIGLSTKKELQELQGIAAPLLEKIRIYLFCAMGILLVVLFWVSWRWAKNFTRPFTELAEGMRRVAGGHFDEKIHISTGDEIEKLADSFNAMTDDLNVYMQELSQAQAKKAQAAAGLDVAIGIQKGLLPKAFPKSEKFSLFARMEPAKEVGGDFYDFYYLGKNRLVLTMASVDSSSHDMGKGIPAALFMAVAKNILRNCLNTSRGKNPAAALQQAMERLAEENVEKLSVNVFVGILDTGTGELSYANTSPTPALLCHGDDIEELAKREDVGELKQGSAVLAQGNVLFLYTDNVWSHSGADGSHLDLTWFQKTMAPIAAESAENITLTMEAAMKSYRQKSGQEGDIALMVLRWNG